MNSPVTGKPMKMIRKADTLTFRKEKFRIMYHYYLCEDSGGRFTDDQLDTLNMAQVTNQYREKYGIPFPGCSTGPFPMVRCLPNTSGYFCGSRMSSRSRWSVVRLFRGKRTGELVRISHGEQAWKDNEQDRQLIDYQRYAFGVGVKF